MGNCYKQSNIIQKNIKQKSKNQFEYNNIIVIDITDNYSQVWTIIPCANLS